MVQPTSKPHPDSAGPVGVEIAHSQTEAGTVFELQPGERTLAPPLLTVCQIDEGLVTQLVTPTIGLTAVEHFVQATLHFFGTNGRAHQADIQVHFPRPTPGLTRLVGEP